jgi:membrane protease YdiL (CAAX protease family)
MMMESVYLLFAYLERIWPALVLFALLFAVVKPPAFGRLVIYIALFVLVRDAMTPLGLWSFGGEGFFWIRMSPDPLVLLLFAAGSLLAMLILLVSDRDNRGWFRYFSNDRTAGLLFGLVAAFLTAAPFIFLYRGLDIAERGGSVAPSLLAPLFLFAMLGNFVEEGLFRGYLLGYLKEYQSPLAAGISSGVIFAFCHIFLAITVTDTGYPLLVFALWEGCIAGIVGSRYGVIPATISHGGAIFLLSSGLL